MSKIVNRINKPIPLDRITIPSNLNGEFGDNRSPLSCHIQAENDIEAVNIWVGEQQSEATKKAYQREAERFILWAIVEKNKPLSSLNREDIFAYRQFMANPGELWIGKKVSKSHLDWRPFECPLSERSIKQAETILRKLFKFLVKQQYLEYDIYESIDPKKTSHKNGDIDTSRSLTQKEWAFLKNAMDKKIDASDLTSDSKKDIRNYKKWIRFRFVIQFLYISGLRIHELTYAKFGDLLKRFNEDNDTTQYWLNVIGKGNKKRTIPIPEGIYLMFEDMIFLFWEENIADCDKKWNIIPMLQGNKPRNDLSLSFMHKIIKEGFKSIHDEYREVNPDFSARIKQISAHWLRHTHGSHAAHKKIPLSVIKENLGHESLSTTSQYIHAEKNIRYDEISKLS